MIISISGKPGSGKSTVAERLAAQLGYRRYYIGNLRRQAARERGLTLAEFNALGEQGEDTDKTFDEYVEQLGRKEDNFVIESRTAFLLIPQSLKIFLDVSDEVGSQRIWLALERQTQSDRNEARDLRSSTDVLVSVRERLTSDKLRYKKLYQTDIFLPRHYDLFLDTTTLDIETEYQQVCDFVKKRLKS